MTARTDPSIRAAAVAAYLAGETCEEVADRFGHPVNRISVRRWVRDAGYNLRTREPRPEAAPFRQALPALDDELRRRCLTSVDVATATDAWRLYQPDRSMGRRPGISELAVLVRTPAPDRLFVVGRQVYYLWDSLLAWMAPALARRWDAAYEARRRDVVARWKRAHARRRTSTPSRYGYQGVRRLHDSIRSQRRWAAVLHYQGRTETLGYCATIEEAARLYDRGLLAISERPVNFPDDAATTMLLPEPHIGPKVSVSTVLRQIVEKHGPIETSAVLDLLPGWPLQPTRPTTRRKASSVFHAQLVERDRIVYVDGGWVPADRAGEYPPSRRPYNFRYDPADKEQVLRAVRDGSSVRSAAKAAGVDRSSASQWVRQAGLSDWPSGWRRREYTAEQRAVAVAAYQSGESARSVANRLGGSPGTVLGWVRAAGVEVRARNGWSR